MMAHMRSSHCRLACFFSICVVFKRMNPNNKGPVGQRALHMRRTIPLICLPPTPMPTLALPAVPLPGCSITHQAVMALPNFIRNAISGTGARSS